MKSNTIISTIKNIAVYALGNFAVRAIALVLIPFFTNTEWVSLKEFGVFSMLEVGIQFLTSLMGLGVYMGLSRFYWDDAFKTERNKMFTNTLGLVFLFSVVVAAALWFVSDWLSVTFFDTAEYGSVIQLAVFSASIQGVLLVILTLLKLQSRSAQYSFVNIFRALATLGLTYWLVISNRGGLVGIYEAQVFSLALCVLIAIPFIWKYLHWGINKSFLHELLKYSLPLMASSVLLILINVFDKYILNAVSGLENVAVYSLGFKLANSIKVFVITSVQLALSPIIMKRMNQRTHGEFYNGVLQLFSVGLMYVILVSVIFGQEIIEVLTVDAAYMDAYPIFVVLSFAFFFDMVKDNIVIGLVIEKKTILSGSISFFIALISFISYRIFAPMWGAMGVAIVFISVKFISVVVVYFFSQKFHHIAYQLNKVFMVLAIGAILYLAVYYTNNMGGWIKYGIKILAVAIYPALIIGLRVLPLPEIKKIFRHLSNTQPEDNI